MADQYNMPKNNQPKMMDYQFSGDDFNEPSALKHQEQADIIAFLNSLPRPRRAMIRIMMDEQFKKGRQSNERSVSDQGHGW